ncbi:MAG: ribosome biogenesis factor YjgA [Methylophilaceae bacterium]|jgi:ribosome-associated protein
MEEHLKSKTQLKKEADDVQTLGVEIAQLPKQKITSLSLPDDAKEAIIFYQHIKKNSAKRRQAQYIGKILRGLDLSQVNEELNVIKNISKLRIKLEHEAERWREKLITSPAALDEFINQYQPDVSNLNQTISNARKESLADKKSKNYRNLYRLILESIQKSD